MDAESVDSILSKDGLRLKNESEVLHSLLHWSIFECCRRELDDTVENRRLVLTSTHLIWRIRFLAAPAEDLWHDPKILSQLLSPEEMSVLLAYRRGQRTADQLPEYIRIHLPRIAQSRNYKTPAAYTTKGKTSLEQSNCSNIPSKGSCIAEKVFICLACIFE